MVLCSSNYYHLAVADFADYLEMSVMWQGVKRILEVGMEYISGTDRRRPMQSDWNMIF